MQFASKANLYAEQAHNTIIYRYFHGSIRCMHFTVNLFLIFIIHKANITWLQKNIQNRYSCRFKYSIDLTHSSSVWWNKIWQYAICTVCFIHLCSALDVWMKQSVLYSLLPSVLLFTSHSIEDGHLYTYTCIIKQFADVGTNCSQLPV